MKRDKQRLQYPKALQPLSTFVEKPTNCSAKKLTFIREHNCTFVSTTK